MTFDSRSKERAERYGSLAQYAEEAYREIEQAVPGIAQTTDVSSYSVQRTSRLICFSTVRFITGGISETAFANNKTLKQIVLKKYRSGVST